jgi:hypothetical protein
LFFNKKSRWTGYTTRRPGGASVHGGPEDRTPPECGLVDDARARSSPQLQKKIEGILSVLTAGFGDRGNGGVKPTVKRRRRQRWCSVSSNWGRVEERRRRAASAVRRGEGAFYRAGEAVGRRRGGGQ